jgi:hypothetical protein
VHDEDEFAKTLFPHIFNHENYSSFVRQLHRYGFRERPCLPDSSNDGKRGKHQNRREYYNPYFRRSHPDMLWLIYDIEDSSESRKKIPRQEMIDDKSGEDGGGGSWANFPLQRPSSAFRDYDSTLNRSTANDTISTDSTNSRILADRMIKEEPGQDNIHTPPQNKRSNIEKLKAPSSFNSKILESNEDIDNVEQQQSINRHREELAEQRNIRERGAQLIQENPDILYQSSRPRLQQQPRLGGKKFVSNHENCEHGKVRPCKCHTCGGCGKTYKSYSTLKHVRRTFRDHCVCRH